ncbi:hypothetical protein [Hyphomonas sp.]|uniref:hypothetical protein n=1 Tax=Hyphomonas sp. TaxID=87 RepID=UPI000C91CA24|nr:hypothetical protein [Hyphomonas sp.]MAL44386.1 hypothetical protein [Hyphomonas sp.]
MALSKITNGGITGMSVSSTDVTVSSGDLLFGTAAKGVCLGVTSNTDGNTLDDYEEGTWTAQMLGTTTNPSATVLATTATYKKVGTMVWAGATFVGVNTTGASGGVVISGMPFNSDFTVPMGNVMSQNTFNVGSTVANITPFWASSTQVWFYHTLHGSNIWGSVQHSAGASRYLYLSLIYTTAS